MKNIRRTLLLATLCACEHQSPTWQEQYDLGVRYLSEGNYEEAIIAFTAAIEIDPKQAPAYVGRGDAYIGSGEAEKNLPAAQADYERAIELDGMLPEAYLGLAEVYIRRGDYEMAENILRDGLERSGGDSMLEDRLSDLELLMTESVKENHENDQIFTEDELKPEDFKIAGKPFWEVSLEEIQALYSGLDGFREGVISTLGGGGSHAFGKLGDHGGIYAEQKDSDTGINYFNINVDERDTDIPIEIRGIHFWDSMTDALGKLGLREEQIEDIFAKGPQANTHFDYDGQNWAVHDWGNGGDRSWSFTFTWDNFTCQTVNHERGLDRYLEAYFGFNENEELTTVHLRVYFLERTRG